MRGLYINMDNSNEDSRYIISYEGNHDKIKRYFNEGEYLSFFFRGGLFFDSLVDIESFFNDRFGILILNDLLSNKDKIAEELIRYEWRLIDQFTTTELIEE